MMFECIFCNNDTTIGEGYNVKTKQCINCETYDLEEPLRRAERQNQQNWWKEEGQYIEGRLFIKYGPR